MPLESSGDVRVVDAIRLMESTGEQEGEELKKYLKAVRVHHKYMLLAVKVEQNPKLKELTRKDITCLSGYHPHPLYVVCTHFPE